LTPHFPNYFVYFCSLTNRNSPGTCLIRRESPNLISCCVISQFPATIRSENISWNSLRRFTKITFWETSIFQEFRSKSSLHPSGTPFKIGEIRQQKRCSCFFSCEDSKIADIKILPIPVRKQKSAPRMQFSPISATYTTILQEYFPNSTLTRDLNFTGTFFPVGYFNLSFSKEIRFSLTSTNLELITVTSADI